MQWVHELGTLSSQSWKFTAMFAGNASGNQWRSEGSAGGADRTRRQIARGGKRTI